MTIGAPPEPRLLPFKPDRLVFGEPIVVTELVRGSAFQCGPADSPRIRAARNGRAAPVLEAAPWLGEFCRANPDHRVYGVFYNRRRYGRDGVVVHAIARPTPSGGWSSVAWNEIDRRGVFADVRRWVPVLHVGPYDERALRRLVRGRSTLPETVERRAGIVVAPLRGDIRERFVLLDEEGAD
jgi:hypothetical protein